MSAKDEEEQAERERLVSKFRWDEIDATSRAQADIPVVNGQLDFTQYEKAMADIRAARAGQAATL